MMTIQWKRKLRLKTLLFFVMVAYLLVHEPGRAQNIKRQKGPEWPRSDRQESIEIDPCSIATAEQLELLIGAKIKDFFPKKFGKKGHWVTLSNPDLRDVSCPNLQMHVLTDARYQKTRGVPQFSSKGKLRFTARVVARVTYNITSIGKVERAVVTEALACMTDIEVIGFNLRRVPNWIDNTYMRKKLNEGFADEVCFDITNLVKDFLKRKGGSPQALRALAISAKKDDDKSTGGDVEDLDLSGVEVESVERNKTGRAIRGRPGQSGQERGAFTRKKFKPSPTSTPRIEQIQKGTKLPVKGYVLTHEHPFAEHAFGGTVMWGSIDGWPDRPCDGGKKTNIGGRPGHAGIKGWFVGPEAFPDAGKHEPLSGPRWDSAFHHRYAAEWIREAFLDGMKIMVVFLYENELLCEVVGAKYNAGRSYECSRGDSFESLARQIDIAKDWAARTPWAEIAYSAKEARDTIKAGKLALVLGVEADYAWGNENSTFDVVERLNTYYDMGVRTFYFAHKINSRLAGAAVEKPAGRAQQYMANSLYLGIGPCKKGEILQGYVLGNVKRPICKHRVRDLSEKGLLKMFQRNGYRDYPLRPGFDDPSGGTYREVDETTPNKTKIEHNWLGLSKDGERVMKEAMKKGMILDIGHLSDRAILDMWEMARVPTHSGERTEKGNIPTKAGEIVPNEYYPLNALHAWPRSRMLQVKKRVLVVNQEVYKEVLVPTEWHLADWALDIIKSTGGIYGQRLGPGEFVDYPESGVVSPPNGCANGTSIEAAHVLAWLLDRGLQVAYALDFHPAKGLKPRGLCGPPTSSFETRVYVEDLGDGRTQIHKQIVVKNEAGYRFNREGLSHIGRMAGFHFDLADIGLKQKYIDRLKNSSAEQFLRMWERSEAIAARLRSPKLQTSPRKIPLRNTRFKRREKP